MHSGYGCVVASWASILGRPFRPIDESIVSLMLWFHWIHLEVKSGVCFMCLKISKGLQGSQASRLSFRACRGRVWRWGRPPLRGARPRSGPLLLAIEQRHRHEQGW